MVDRKEKCANKGGDGDEGKNGMIMYHSFGNHRAIEEIRKLLEVANTVGGNLSITELYEEDGGILCQIHGKDVELEVVFHVYSDLDDNRFVWCEKKYMPFVPKETKECRVCGREGAYILKVDGERYEHVCAECLGDLSRIWLFVKDRTLDWEPYTWETTRPYGRSNPENFVGHVLFYAERIYPVASNHRDNLFLMLTNPRVLPTSEHTEEFVEWIGRNRDRHYPSWFTSVFVEKGKVPVPEHVIGTKILEAALDFMDEKGIEPNPPAIDGTGSCFRNGQKWYTKEVVPMELYVTGFEKKIHFVGLVDGTPALFYTRTQRKGFDYRNVIWGHPVKMRFRVEEVPAVWNGHRIEVMGTNITGV